MAAKRLFTGPPACRAVRFGVVLLAGLLFGAACGCTKDQRALSAIRKAYAAGSHAEAAVLCERAAAVSVADVTVYYYWGLSLLALDRDLESFSRFERAVSMDSTIAPDISRHLVVKAREAFAGGKVSRSTQRLRAAVGFDPHEEVGPLEYLLADSFFGDNRWHEALRYYTVALSEHPDTAAAEKGHFCLAACYAALGDSASAAGALENQLSRFPRGTLASRAEWNLSNILFSRARSEFHRGNYEISASLANRILSGSENSVFSYRARFLLGESYERVGDFAGAYEQYKAIVEGKWGVPPARVVERARAKILAFRDAGLP